MTIRRKNTRAFATIFALVCLMLAGITIGGLMTRMSMQARRTSHEAHRAQQEQIRIAQLLAADPGKITLPREIR